MFEESALDPERHDRAGFNCGVPELDAYLKQFAHQHAKRGIAKTFVLTAADQPQTILGFYTLSAAQIDLAQLAEADRKKLPRYPVPCFRMGRLACSVDRQGEGIGRLLIGRAVARCLDAGRQVAAFALIVDAKDEQAARFYRHYGFTGCADRSLTLYLTLGGKI